MTEEEYQQAVQAEWEAARFFMAGSPIFDELAAAHPEVVLA